MKITKIPLMEKKDYDRLITREYMCRIAFKGEEYPHIAPFLYFFDGKFLYFLSTKYGKKIRYFQQNPKVTVEIEKYRRDLSKYNFVTLSGQITEVKDPAENNTIRVKFVQLIKNKKISKNFMVALGHQPEEPLETIVKSERTLVWKLVRVIEIKGLDYQKNST